MAKRQLFYEGATPLSPERHGQWSVDAGSDFGFARAVNSVPVLTTEFGAAGDEYPIVFVGEGAAVFPRVLLGLRGDENLFVDDRGRWTGRYTPAFIRRYPFVFSENAERGTFLVCIDEAFPGCNTEGRGHRLFDGDGEGTAWLGGMVDLLKKSQTAFEQTRSFARRIAELDLLAPMAAQFDLPGDRHAQLRGFSAIDRDRLKALPDGTLAGLARSDMLELIYRHLHTMRHVGRLVERLDRRMG